VTPGFGVTPPAFPAFCILLSLVDHRPRGGRPANPGGRVRTPRGRLHNMVMLTSRPRACVHCNFEARKGLVK